MNKDKTMTLRLNLLADRFNNFFCKPNDFRMKVVADEFSDFLMNIVYVLPTGIKYKIMKLYVNENRADILCIDIFDRKTNMCYMSTFKLLYTIDCQYDQLKYNNLQQFDAEIVLNTLKLYKMFKRMKSIATRVKIMCNKEKITFSFSHNDENIPYTTTTCVQNLLSNCIDRANIDYTNIDIRKDYVYDNTDKTIQGIYDFNDVFSFIECHKYCGTVVLQLQIKNNDIMAIRQMVCTVF